MTKVFEFKSKGGLFPHTHILRLSDQDLQNASEEGILLTTSVEYSLIFKHSHQVKISKTDLKNIRAGQAVTVSDTDKGRHSFLIQVT